MRHSNQARKPLLVALNIKAPTLSSCWFSEDLPWNEWWPPDSRYRRNTDTVQSCFLALSDKLLYIYSQYSLRSQSLRLWPRNITLLITVWAGCSLVWLYTTHRLQPFIITLIPELLLLGNQSVIHHYLSSAQKGPEDSSTHTRKNTRGPRANKHALRLVGTGTPCPHTPRGMHLPTRRCSGIAVER